MRNSKQVAIAISLAGITIFSGCKKDDLTENPPLVDDIYTPPSNLSREEIVSLILEAEKATYKIKKISIVTNESLFENNKTFQVEKEDLFNAETKKFIKISYSNKEIESVYYIEGNDSYYYLSSGRAKEIQRPISNSDQYYYCSDDGNWINKPTNNAICKVENEKLIVIDTLKFNDYFQVRNKAYTLNTARQCKKLTLNSFDKDYDDNIIKTRDVERSYTYGTANPALPSGLNKEDFTNKQSDYYSIKVIWNEGKGENTFWVRKGNSFNLSYISSLSHAPEVAGKNIIEFTINGKTYSKGSIIQITDNNTEINVIWGANIDTFQAKSTLLRNEN